VLRWAKARGSFRAVSTRKSSRTDLVPAAILVATVIASGCTFYTGQPPAPSTNQPNGTGGSPAAGGPTSNAGASGQQEPGGGDGGDAGASSVPVWTDVTGDLEGRSVANPGVVFLTAQPGVDRLIAGVSGLGLWATDNGGRSWGALGATGASVLIVNVVSSVVFDPQDPNVFWESGIYNGGGIFKTSDGGETFQRLGDGIVSHNDLISVDFTDPQRRTMLAGWHEQNQKLYRSTDAGVNWEDIGPSLPASCGFSSAPLVLDSETYLLGCVNQIVRTEDGAKTWDVVSLAGGFAAPLVTSDGTIYWRIDASFGLMRSSDLGKTWVRAVGVGAIRGNVIELPDGRLASYGGDFVVISDDGGSSWTELGPKLPFLPGSVVYLPERRAFYIWIDSPEPRIPARSILRYDWDYETE
jgi:hypothetical protein